MRDARAKGPAPEPRTGIVGGTMVETPTGWQAAETLTPGDRVYVMDGSARELRDVRRRRLGADVGAEFPTGLILVPGGALENCEAFYLVPEALVLFHGPAAEALSGAGAAFVRAADLAGRGGIGWAIPVDGAEIVRLSFGGEEVVCANSGVLLHCPAGDRGRDAPRRFPVLGARAARDLLVRRFADGAGQPSGRAGGRRMENT